LRRDPFEDPLPRVVPGEVVEPTPPPPPPHDEPPPHDQPRPHDEPPAHDEPPTRYEPPAARDTPEDPEPDDGYPDNPADAPAAGEPAPGPALPARTRPPRPFRPGSAPDEPSVAVLTLRDVRPIADYGGLHEAEDALVDALGAGLYHVVLASPRYRRGPFSSPVVRRALNTTRVLHPFRIEHHGRDAANTQADALLVLARDVTDAAALLGVPGWFELGRTVIVHIAVVTEKALRRNPDFVVQLRRRADALFSGTEMPPLGHLRSERLETVGVVPPLLDVLAFPLDDGRERTIDVFSPDARPPGQDQLLQHWAQSHRGSYQQSVGSLGADTSHTQHRRIFTSMAARSRLFLTNFVQFDTRRHAGAHREVDGRFYDAMAAGCALVGDLPVGSRRFSALVAPAMPMNLPLDAQQLPTEVSEALSDRAVSRRLGEVARATALRHGDAAHRWVEMSRLAGLPGSPGIQQRIAALAAQADRLDPPT
jgi:hypothetical protein